VLFKFDSEVSEFLSALKTGTHNIYRRGLEAFQEFYSSQAPSRFLRSCGV
jgi:hypothetical protein